MVRPIYYANIYRLRNLIAISLIFLGAGFWLGSAYQRMVSNRPNLPLTTPTRPASLVYVSYRYIIPDAAIPVFQTEIPATWSAFTTSFDLPVCSISFGESHVMDQGRQEDVPTQIEVRLTSDPKLAKSDPTSWSYSDQLNIFSTTFAPADTYTPISVNNIPGRKYEVRNTLSGNAITVIYLTKGDNVFTVINRTASTPVFSHLVSTFQLLSGNVPPVNAAKRPTAC